MPRTSPTADPQVQALLLGEHGAAASNPKPLPLLEDKKSPEEIAQEKEEAKRAREAKKKELAEKRNQPDNEANIWLTKLPGDLHNSKMALKQISQNRSVPGLVSGIAAIEPPE